MGRELELEWPAHPMYPQHGYVVRRRELDQLVAANAERAGATLLQGHEAVHPIVERGFVRGATVAAAGRRDRVDIRAEFTIVADGANSRFGRALGTFRTREWPYGTAIRTYWESPTHAEPWIESALDVKDRNGNPMPGYGWIFPVGDGTVNIGVGLLSTFRDFKSVNTTHLLDAYAHQIADRWEIDPDRPGVPADERPDPDGRLGRPEGRADLPRRRRRRRQRQPVQRRGHRLRLRDGADGRRRAPRGARRPATPTALQRYPKLLDDEYGQYFKVARLFARVIGRPALMRELTRAGMHSRTLMEWVLRIMANLLRPDELGPAEAAYKAAAALVRLAPTSGLDRSDDSASLGCLVRLAAPALRVRST